MSPPLSTTLDRRPLAAFALQGREPMAPYIAKHAWYANGYELRSQQWAIQKFEEIKTNQSRQGTPAIHPYRDDALHSPENVWYKQAGTRSTGPAN